MLPDALNPCGQVWYLTQEDAERAMQHMRSTPKFERSVYFCKRCDGYHVSVKRRSPSERLEAAKARIEASVRDIRAQAELLHSIAFPTPPSNVN